MSFILLCLSTVCEFESYILLDRLISTAAPVYLHVSMHVNAWAIPRYY